MANFKLKKYVSELSYQDILEQIIAGMLVFEGLPESVHSEFIPIYKMREGLCAIVDDVDGGAVGHCTLGGTGRSEKLYTNGFGRTAIVSFDNGVVKEYQDWETNPHIVVMFNDVLMRPDLNIGRYAEMLTQIDTSIVLNIIYSRYLPIPVANNEDQRKALDHILDGLIKGDTLKALLSDDILSELTGQRGIDVLNISDVNNADKIQYLSMLHDDFMRRFYQLYGMDVDGTGKMAQQTVAEVGSRQGASMIIPYNMMAEAQKAVDQMRAKFGWDCSVHFGKPWEYDLNNNGVLDVLEDDAEDAPEDTPEDTPEDKQEDADDERNEG